MAYSKPSIGIWFSDQVLTESLGMIGEGRSCKARKPEADVYQSFVASSCIISTGTTVGDASKAYGSDSIRLYWAAVLLLIRLWGEDTGSDDDSEDYSTVTQHGKNGMYANRNFQLKPLPLSSMGLCRHLFGDAFEKIRFPCLILVLYFVFYIYVLYLWCLLSHHIIENHTKIRFRWGIILISYCFLK